MIIFIIATTAAAATTITVTTTATGTATNTTPPTQPTPPQPPTPPTPPTPSPTCLMPPPAQPSAPRPMPLQTPHPPPPPPPPPTPPTSPPPQFIDYEEIEPSEARKGVRALGDTDEAAIGGGISELPDIVCLVFAYQILNSKSASYPWLEDLALGDDLAFRLASGNDTYGRLEVLDGGQWGTICNKNFGLTEAVVACRTLGLPRFNIDITTAKKSGIPVNTSDTILLSGFSCSGDEFNLTDCTVYANNTNNCTHEDDLVISCTAASRHIFYPQVLGDKGRYQIWINNVLGSVCYDANDDNAAKVACSALGHSREGAKVLRNETVPPGPMLLNVESCMGNESSLYMCNADPLGFNKTCREPLLIRCRTSPTTPGPVHNPDHTGLIVGLSLGGVLAIVLVLGFIYIIRKRRYERRGTEKGSLIEYDAKYINTKGVI